MFRGYVDRGNTIIMSTHTLEVAETLCDRLAIVQHGKILAMGTIAELRAKSDPGTTLEEIFLRLTGEKAARTTLEVLSV